jgi:hypothetical protein
MCTVLILTYLKGCRRTFAETRSAVGSGPIQALCCLPPRYRPTKSGKFSVGDSSENSGGAADNDSGGRDAGRAVAEELAAGGAISMLSLRRKVVNQLIWSMDQLSQTFLGSLPKTARVRLAILRTARHVT